MTWKEIKEKIESLGIKDDDKIFILTISVEDKLETTRRLLANIEETEWSIING